MKRITTETIHEYKDRLNDSEDLIGNGAYGNVYQHPENDNIVVKVFDANYDRAYAKFLKWAKKNQDNPYVPKIYGVEEFFNSRNTQKITVVFLEKLKFARMRDAEDLVDKYSSPSYGDCIDDSDRWREVAKETKDKHLKKLAKFFVQHEDDLDLHDENFMIRPGTNQLVFTDPLA